jgi:hypothetical protein
MPTERVSLRRVVCHLAEEISMLTRGAEQGKSMSKLKLYGGAKNRGQGVMQTGSNEPVAATAQKNLRW